MCTFSVNVSNFQSFPPYWVTLLSGLSFCSYLMAPFQFCWSTEGDGRWFCHKFLSLHTATLKEELQRFLNIYPNICPSVAYYIQIHQVPVSKSWKQNSSGYNNLFFPTQQYSLLATHMTKSYNFELESHRVLRLCEGYPNKSGLWASRREEFPYGCRRRKTGFACKFSRSSRLQYFV